jgi:hypothetical protein
MKRVETLERELKDIKGRVASNAGVEEIYDDLNGGLEEIEKSVRKNQRRAEAARVTQEKRLAALEKNLAFLLEDRRRSITYGSSPSTGSSLTYAALVVPRTIWSFVTPSSGHREDDFAVKEKLNSKRQLDTIPEDPVDDPAEELSPNNTNHSKPVSYPSSFKITVSPFSLIGLTTAAVTWPLRAFIAIFLAIQKLFS